MISIVEKQKSRVAIIDVRLSQNNSCDMKYMRGIVRVEKIREGNRADQSDTQNTLKLRS